jgi:DNA-binding NarL/FixJ family response regulator
MALAISDPAPSPLLDPATRAPIRVLIADGDPRVGRALERLLRDAAEVEVVAIATDGETTPELAIRLQPAVAIIDAWTSRLDGLEVTRSLRQAVPATQVVVVGIYAAFREPALAAGACRFLLKDCGRDELITAIRLAAQEQCQAPEND